MKQKIKGSMLLIIFSLVNRDKYLKERKFVITR